MCPADLWLRDEKRALRRVMASRREELSVDERARCAQAATDLLLDLPEVSAARAVAAFVSTRAEIDTSRAIEGLRRRGIAVVLPRVSAELLPPRLRFHRVEGPSELVFGIFGCLSLGLAVPRWHLMTLMFSWSRASLRRARWPCRIRGRLLRRADGLCARSPGRAVGFLRRVWIRFPACGSCPTGEWDVPIHCVVTDARVVRCGAVPE